jgi:hypothetical protein
MQDLAEKLNKITDSNERFKARAKLEGLLDENNKQLDKLEDMSNLIIANKSLQEEVSKHYKFPSDAPPAKIISGRLQNLIDSYVHISLLTAGGDLTAYIQEKTGQSV